MDGRSEPGENSGVTLQQRSEGMRKMLVQACILGPLAAWPLYHQRRQATPPDMATATNSRGSPSPMLVDIPLGAGTSANGKQRKAFNDSPAGPWPLSQPLDDDGAHAVLHAF